MLARLAHNPTIMRSAAAAAPAGANLPRRMMATEAAEEAPPKKLFGLPARYANALYKAAAKTKTLDTVEQELLGVKSALVKSPEFSQYLTNPTISRTEKVGTVEKLFDGSKVSPLTKNLMGVLAANDRLGQTVKVVDTYCELMKAKRGEVEVTVTSAEPLSAAQKTAVQSALSSQLKGSGVNLTLKEDPALLGGLVVQIEDEIMDLSIATQVNNISRILKGEA